MSIFVPDNEPRNRRWLRVGCSKKSCKFFQSYGKTVTLQTKRDMAIEIVETKAIEQSDSLYKGVPGIIDNARQEVVVYVNKHSDLMFWHIGHYINEDMATSGILPMAAKFLRNCRQTVRGVSISS